WDAAKNSSVCTINACSTSSCSRSRAGGAYRTNGDFQQDSQNKPKLADRFRGLIGSMFDE
ncbi:hypothetical protein, partial [Tannerella forsythia]|uniref:hypothetical protein n=1 Tax=Tannerella forsythia TaxID=28112 RepID=UPI001C5495BF